MSLQNPEEFQKSITRELIATKDRVEFLIGSANWGEVGSYKEVILRKIISQYLPSNLSIGTGFIVSNDDYLLGSNNKISKQLDIIIYDNRNSVVFKEGDFIIITDSMAKAVIEVKSEVINYSIDKENALNNIARKLNELSTFESFRLGQQGHNKFVGIFSYNYDVNLDCNTNDCVTNRGRLRDALQESNGLVNHISLGQNIFIKYWENTINLNPRPIYNNNEYNGRCYIRYSIEELSFSYFISNLLHIVSDNPQTERYWYSFPIEDGKETRRARFEPIIPLPDLQQRRRR